MSQSSGPGKHRPVLEQALPGLGGERGCLAVCSQLRGKRAVALASPQGREQSEQGTRRRARTSPKDYYSRNTKSNFKTALYHIYDGELWARLLLLCLG